MLTDAEHHRKRPVALVELGHTRENVVELALHVTYHQPEQRLVHRPGVMHRATKEKHSEREMQKPTYSLMGWAVAGAATAPAEPAPAPEPAMESAIDPTLAAELAAGEV